MTFEGFINAPASKVLCLLVTWVSIAGGMCDPTALRSTSESSSPSSSSFLQPSFVLGLLRGFQCPTASATLLSAVLLYTVSRTHERALGTKRFLAEGMMVHLVALFCYLAVYATLSSTSSLFVDGPHLILVWLCVTQWAHYPAFCSVGEYHRLLSNHTAVAILFFHYVFLSSASPPESLKLLLACLIDAAGVIVFWHMRAVVAPLYPRWIFRVYQSLCALLTTLVLPRVQADSCLSYQVWR